MKKFLLFNTFIVCGLFIETGAVAALNMCGAIDLEPAISSYSITGDDFLYSSQTTFNQVQSAYDRYKYASITDNPHMRGAFNQYTRVNGHLYKCGGTGGCNIGLKIRLSNAVLKQQVQQGVNVFECKRRGNDSHYWDKLSLSKCTREQLDATGGWVANDGNKYYYSLANNSVCYIECKDNEILDTGRKECKKNVSVKQPAQTKVSEQTKTQQQSTTANNTNNSNQTAQKNNTSSNKPAPSQQQATVEEYECDQEKLQQLVGWKITYATNQKILAAIKQLEDYCEGKNKQPDDFNTMYQTLSEMIDKLEEENALQKQKEQEAAKQAANEKEQQQSRTKITSTIKILDDISGRFELSVWKDEDGNFNTARLVSDSVAGVVLGTAGGLITSNVVKKNQVESGFEDIKCTIGGQVVADWGDQFRVGIR